MKHHPTTSAGTPHSSPTQKQGDCSPGLSHAPAVLQHIHYEPYRPTSLSSEGAADGTSTDAIGTPSPTINGDAAATAFPPGLPVRTASWPAMALSTLRDAPRFPFGEEDGFARRDGEDDDDDDDDVPREPQWRLFPRTHPPEQVNSPMITSSTLPNYHSNSSYHDDVLSPNAYRTPLLGFSHAPHRDGGSRSANDDDVADRANYRKHERLPPSAAASTTAPSTATSAAAASAARLPVLNMRNVDDDEDDAGGARPSPLERPQPRLPRPKLRMRSGPYNVYGQ